MAKINVYEGFNDYLKRNEYAPTSIKIYIDRIKKIVSEGYTLPYLVKNLKSITKTYYEGGVNYDPKDHGNTAAALQQFRGYLVELKEKRKSAV